MAYYSIFPKKDTTLYSHPDRIHMNTGKDEALELVEEKSSLGDVYYTSRILIKSLNSGGASQYSFLYKSIVGTPEYIASKKVVSG